MPEIILYFGPLELLLILLGVIILTILLVVVIHDTRRASELQNLLDGFPYPAILYRKFRKPCSNGTAGRWIESMGITALVNDAQIRKQNIFRKIPDVE